MASRFAAVLALLCLTSSPLPAATRIEIAGGEQALRSNVEAHLELADMPCDAPAWKVRSLFERAERAIRPALRALGYYAPTIRKRLEQGGECWLAVFEIEPGAPVRLSEVRVELAGEAADDPAFAEVLAGSPLQRGAILNHGQYEALKDSLLGIAARRGYFEARFTRHSIRVDIKAGAAAVELVMDSGPRYRLGEPQLPDTKLDAGLVRRLAGVAPGAYYDADTLSRIDRNLSESKYFAAVDVRPLSDEARDGTVPLAIDLRMRPRHAWRAGIGYATDQGPRLTGGYSNRYLNARGHRADLEARLSPVETRFKANYLLPGDDPVREADTFDLVLRHEDNESAITDSVSLGARHSLKAGHWTRARSLELLFEDSVVGETRTTARLFMPGLSYSTTTADDVLRTSRGYRARIEVRGAHESLGSTATFLQLRGGMKGIYRVPGLGRLSARADVGATLADSFFSLPASLRFFAGGDNSVRGYAYKELGPADADGEPQGGRHLLTTSLEYEHPIPGDEDWWGAVFVDAGNAFSGDLPPLKVGYGLGVRWYSPIGRVRADLAFPRDTARDDWRLHFSVGVDL